ncbi:hypothetical protein [Bacillus sp. 3255]|uniref:hypothetical protein n=1 Tax=Bacillus sp. 3255 TaxID=2817904 RepID=UPI00285CC98E|nr:hypothetical protein [Bacillus sp. 3255]MDR6884864.1 uncharacterized protein YbjQ (UPF0145 family) [Bacillus sp. 3255]
MFGRKQDTPINNPKPVPVYTVHSLPQAFEPMQMVWAKESGGLEIPFDDLVKSLGEAGASVGADAVIGATFERNAVSKFVYMTGTAIRYK